MLLIGNIEAIKHIIFMTNIVITVIIVRLFLFLTNSNVIIIIMNIIVFIINLIVVPMWVRAHTVMCP